MQLIQKLDDDKKCMKKVEPLSRSKAIEDIINIRSFVEALVLNHYVPVDVVGEGVQYTARHMLMLLLLLSVWGFSARRAIRFSPNDAATVRGVDLARFPLMLIALEFYNAAMQCFRAPELRYHRLIAHHYKLREHVGCLAFHATANCRMGNGMRHPYDPFFFAPAISFSFKGESLSEAWARFKDLLQKVPHHGVDFWLKIQIFYDHVSFHLKSEIDLAASSKLRDRNAEESWEIIDNLALYDHEGWNDPKDFTKSVKAISLPQDTLKMPDRRLLKLEDQISYLLKGSRTITEISSTHVPQAYAKLTSSRASEKVLVREEARHPVTKHVNSISFIKIKEEKSIKNNEVVNKNAVEHKKSNVVEPIEEVDEKEEVEDGTNDEPVRSMNGGLMGEKVEELVEMPRSQPVGFYLKHKINKELIEGLVENERFNDSLLAVQLGKIERKAYDPLPIGPIHNAMLKKKDIQKRGYERVNFHKILDFLCKIKEEAENDIDPVTPTSTVSKLILEWEERIKLHQEKEMKFNEWRSKVFKDESFAFKKRRL
ncbi:hypothetical protein Tco_1068461 [Tanacetum coccineum]|uniref:Uncharacterized protein n=1 Tax=Tanacetum coccineum TaxID=301880 RepID=A0ABQ5HH75_9ASTR